MRVVRDDLAREIALFKGKERYVDLPCDAYLSFLGSKRICKKKVVERSSSVKVQVGGFWRLGIRRRLKWDLNEKLQIRSEYCRN